MQNLWLKLYFPQLIKLYTSVSLLFIQQWTMTIVDRSCENSDHESVGCQRSPFTSGDVGMDGSCSSSWAMGPTMPSDSPRLKAPGGCLGPAPGAVVYNSTPSSVDRPKEQGRSKCFYQLWFLLCMCLETWKETFRMLARYTCSIACRPVLSQVILPASIYPSHSSRHKEEFTDHCCPAVLLGMHLRLMTMMNVIF